MSQLKLERHVLIGIDDSTDASAAFDYYVQHLHRPRNKVVLLHVVKPFIISTNQTAAEKKISREQALINEKSTIDKLQQRYTDMMKQNSIPGRINVVSYSREPGKILCEVAAEDRCSYVVVGCRAAAADGGRTASYGDVVDHVLRKSKCPVVVVRYIKEPTAVGRKASILPAVVAADERRRRVSCPSRFTGLDMNGGTSASSSSIQPAAARQRRHSTFVAPNLDRLALLEEQQSPRRQGKSALERRLSVKYEDAEEDDEF